MDSGDAVLRIYAGGLVRVSKCCLAIRWDGGQGRFPTASTLVSIPLEIYLDRSRDIPRKSVRTNKLATF